MIIDGLLAETAKEHLVRAELDWLRAGGQCTAVAAMATEAAVRNLCGDAVAEDALREAWSVPFVDGQRPMYLARGL